MDSIGVEVVVEEQKRPQGEMEQDDITIQMNTGLVGNV